MVGESEPDPEDRREGVMNVDTWLDVVGFIVKLLTERFEHDWFFLSAESLLHVESPLLALLLVEFAVGGLRLDEMFTERLPPYFCKSELA